MGSVAFCLASVHHVLGLANPEHLRWLVSNEQQGRFFDAYGEAAADFAGPTAWLTGKVTSDATVLQTWLAERGWPDVVVAMPPDGLALASVFDLLLAWKEHGSRLSIEVRAEGDGGSDDGVCVYEGARMHASASLRAYSIAGHPTPMFEIDTRSPGWKVCLVEAAPACSPLDLTAVAVELLGRDRTPSSPSCGSPSSRCAPTSMSRGWKACASTASPGQSVTLGRR